MNKLSGLYGITDPELLPGAKLITGVEAALIGGANLIQYRNKKASEVERLREAANLRRLTQDYGACLIINDDVDLALRTGAAGVHLGKQDGDLASARRRLGPHAIIGVTCHDDLSYAQTCFEQGASYCAFGRLFPSHTKPEAPACDFSVIEHAAQAPYPCVAIGGIDENNAERVVYSGADMIAVIHGLFGQENITLAAQKLSALFV